jgi:hypothetical protein
MKIDEMMGVLRGMHCPTFYQHRSFNLSKGFAIITFVATHRDFKPKLRFVQVSEGLLLTMARSSSGVDYSIGQSISEVMSKRTKFATLMRPGQEADEPFLSTLYGLDANGTRSSKKNSSDQAAPNSDWAYKMAADQRDTSSTFSSEDSIRRGFVDDIAHQALTKI